MLLFQFFCPCDNINDEERTELTFRKITERYVDGGRQDKGVAKVVDSQSKGTGFDSESWQLTCN